MNEKGNEKKEMKNKTTAFEAMQEFIQRASERAGAQL